MSFQKKTDKKECGICGSTSLHSLAVTPRRESTIICLDCGAKWFKKWYTAKDWFLWING